ncbi:MAG TPA: CCA tRNA nucleotidyltransferase [Phycisphaerae bacterium]|nr:CCA tRNA nucleotidyltransferase [Phycisphaerae bacterium]
MSDNPSDGHNTPTMTYAPNDPADMLGAADLVVRKLREAGHVAYFAGGCVRDLAMDRPASDYDVATSATPDQVIGLFHRTMQVGAKFGVVLVRLKRQQIEVATFRTDHDYADGRRPTGVTFSSPEQDAQRRDFTINGMFFDPIAGQIIDYVGGQADIAARVVRAIGDPDRRFAEDHLRLLRAIRFAARLNFDIEPATWSALRKHAPELRQISPERVCMELESILTNVHRARAVKLTIESGLIDHLWPGSEQLRESAESAIRRLRELPEKSGLELALAILLGELSLPEVEKSVTALRCSNETIARVCWLVAHQHDFNEPTRLTLADLKLLMANENFADLLAFFNARLEADGADTTACNIIRARADAIPPEAVKPTPLVNGNDLQAMGLKPGPAFKRILERLYYLQLNEELVERDQALALAGELAAKE